MAEAEVGDDVFGEDPTVRALEEEVADLLGHEAGLFCPTGSLANQLGLRLHVPPGAELVADSLAHVVRAELGAAAVFSGITSRTWAGDAGRLRASDPIAMLQLGVGPYQVETRLVVVENTHNFGGGTIQPLTEIRALRDGLAGTGVPMHLDGARLWNAHVATGVELTAYGQLFDTVSVCLSKGLGAPVGSVLVGSAEAMSRARVWRKRYGAGMRQSGILAAAGLYAVEHHLERLADDHGRARRFAEAIAEVGPYVTLADVETNIVMVDTSGTGRSAAQVAVAVGERGIRAYPSGKDRVRLVWHLDVDDAGTDAAIAAFREVLGQGAG
jgi:threonine aldolase